jgi:hypothetical protein
VTIRLRPSYEIDVIGTEIHYSPGGVVKRRSARGISPSSRRSLVSLIISVSAGSRSLEKGPAHAAEQRRWKWRTPACTMIAGWRHSDRYMWKHCSCAGRGFMLSSRPKFAGGNEGVRGVVDMVIRVWRAGSRVGTGSERARNVLV